MEEEDDSGYEARSTVTTSNSICQTDLQQLVYNSFTRPATVNYTNYSNYSSNSLIQSSTSLNELRSPRSNINTSRPQSSAYSTISSCSLNNRPFYHPISTFEQQHPSLEEYQPLDQFKSLDQFDQTNQSTNMSTNRSLNFRTLSPDYEQDWSAGEQDEDYVIEHVRPVHRQIDHVNRSLARRNRYRLLDDDLEQNNDIEYLDRPNFDREVNPNDNLDEISSNKNDNNHHQLVNILNSPLDRTPFSSPLSLPSSNLSNSNESSNNSSPKIKLPESSFSESSSLTESPTHSKQSSKVKSTDKTSTISPTSIKQESPNPVYLSEEEFASRKSALRERINRTEMLLNSINNNCNRFRTITSAINSRSQELLNQRRQAEIEIDNIVQQSSEPYNGGLNKVNSFNTFQQQPRIERDSQSTIENQESHIEPLLDNSITTAKNEMNKIEVITDRIVQSKKDKVDKTQQAGDANKLTATTMKFSNPTSYKDTTEPIDHLNKLNLTVSRNGSNMNLQTNDLSSNTTMSTPINTTVNTPINSTMNTSMNTTLNEWPTPRTKPPSIPDSNLNKHINDNQLLSIKNNESKNNLATSEFKFSSNQISSSSLEQQRSLDEKVEKSDSKSSLKSEIKSDFEINSKINSKNNSKSSLLSDSKTNLRPDAKIDSRTSSRDEFRTSPRSDLKSNRNSDKIKSLKNNFKSKLKNNLKNNLTDIKSDLSDLSDLLNIQTVPKTTSLPTDVKLMSFTLPKQEQPNKSVNTEIDSRLMDHILSKICAQRDMQNASSNQPSTSSQEAMNEQTKKMNKIERKKIESTESKHCQTDKIQNQEVSVSVNESDLEAQKKRMMNSENDEKKRKEKCNSSEQTECSKSELCENCRKRCYSSQMLIDCNRQFNRQESLNHCYCIKCAQETCASIFHPNHSHLPVCINTFNHNTFTSLPNLTAHSPINVARIEQGTNTEPNIDTDLIELNPNKRDKQTQCVLGLSLEQQQREYIEQQQQKYLKLKEELKAKEKIKSDNDQKNSDKVLKSDMDKTYKVDEIKERDKRELESGQDEKDIKKDSEEQNSIKQTQKEVESSKKFESDKDVSIDFAKDSIVSNKDTTISFNEEKISSTIESDSPDKNEICSDKDETSSNKDEISSQKDKKTSLDVTLPVKLPFKSDNIERKFIDLRKEKNVKTHSKIIIEFSGKSKRERSAVDSFTKLDRDGKLTKKTLVSNTKEISVPVKITKDKNEKNQQKTDRNLNLYPLSSTPQKHKLTNSNNYSSSTISSAAATSPTNENDNHQLISNQNALYLCKKDQTNANQQWKEASHSEITNEMSADPLLDENNEAHPTKSIALSTITTFDRTIPGQPQRIDHSNKYQRCFENPSIHEPLIESNLTILDEPNGQETASNLSSSSSIENLVEETVDEKRLKTDENLNRINNLRTLNNEQIDSTAPKTDFRKDHIRTDLRPDSKIDDRRNELSSSESVDSRLSNSSQSRVSDHTLVAKNEEPDINVNSRSASRVSFNLPDNYRDTDSSRSQNNHFIQPINSYSTEILESNLDHELDNQETDLDRVKQTKRTRSIPTSQQQPTGLLETELDDHLFYDAEDDEHNYNQNNDLNNLQTYQQEDVNRPYDYFKQYNEQYNYSQPYTQQQNGQNPQLSKSKSKERKSKSSKKKSHQQSSKSAGPEQVSDQSSLLFSTKKPKAKQLNDSGFLSPEIYHSSPYELAYKQVNKDEKIEKIKEKKQSSKSDKKKSSSDKKTDKKSKHKNLLRNGDNGLQFTERSSNTEIITRLTKTSYPSNANIDLNLQPKLIEKQLKQLKRNKMVLDQILNSPEIKSSSSKSTNAKKSCRDEKKKSGCKISSKITMDLPIYKETKTIQKTAKSVSCPVKSVSLEELDKERDLDRKSVVSQHSYSQQSGEFNTMTKFHRYKPSSSKSSKKNKSTIHLNQPDETNWEYTMQCNCVNGSKANVLTNVKHRRILFFPLQQYETSL